MSSGKFAMAVHALALLATSDDGHPSEYVAGSVNTHAVFLRRILGRLREAGLVTTREGRGGRYLLAKPAEKISLADVYRAVEEDGPLAPSPAAPNPRCPVGSGMRGAFEDVAQDAHKALLATLSRKTIADVSRSAVRRGAAHKS